MSAQLAFLIICTVYSALLIGISVWSRNRVKDTSDYLLAGRNISFFLNTTGVLAIGFSGTSVSLNCGFAISHGVWGSILYGGIFALIGLGAYGLFFSHFVRRCGAQTLPEYFEMRFGSGVRSVVSWGSILGLCGILANNIAAAAGIVSSYTGWPYFLCVTGIFLLILVFSYISGMWSVTLTDFAQVIMGLIASPLLILACVKTFGGLSYLEGAFPGGDFWTQGLTGESLPLLTLQYPSALSFAAVSGAFFVWGNNYYWLRVASCRNEKDARGSYILAAVILFLVFYVPFAFLGAYGGAANIDAFTGGNTSTTVVYGLVIKFFPLVLSSYFLISAMAASVSSATTAAIGATATASRDIYQRHIRPDASPAHLLKASKWIMLVIGVVVWILCFFPGGPTYLLAFSGAWLGPPAVILVLSIFWRRCTSRGAFWGVVTGMATLAVLTLAELLGLFSIASVMHSGFAGAFVTIAVSIAVSLATQPAYYGTKNWRADSGTVRPEDVSVDGFDLKILDMLRYGHRYMSDLTDALQVDSRVSGRSIEKLDRGGYLLREGLTKSAFYAYRITEKGLAALPVLEGRALEMARDGLRPVYLEVLRQAAEDMDGLPRLEVEYELTSLEISSILSHMVRKGYIREKGVFRRRLIVTDRGREMIRKYVDPRDIPPDTTEGAS